jgi:hypothetical protein
MLTREYAFGGGRLTSRWPSVPAPARDGVRTVTTVLEDHGLGHYSSYTPSYLPIPPDNSQSTALRQARLCNLVFAVVYVNAIYT